MATAVIEYAPQPAAPTKSKLQESIQESTEMLIAQLRAGKSAALTEYLTTMARFHSYSFCNQLLIARQCPTATRVAGFHKWLEMKRYVKKGEKGIAILAPMMTTKPSKDADETAKPGPRLIGFKVVYVFDLAQTDGEALAEPDFMAHHGNAEGLSAKLIAHIESTGFPVIYDPAIAPALGMCYPDKIALLPGAAPADDFATLVHEFAHHLLHQGERRQQTNKTIRETEAEATAFIVATAMGLNSGTASADYIQLYNGSTETLIESLQHIQKAAAEILTAMGEKMNSADQVTDFKLEQEDGQPVRVYALMQALNRYCGDRAEEYSFSVSPAFTDRYANPGPRLPAPIRRRLFAYAVEGNSEGYYVHIGATIHPDRQGPIEYIDLGFCKTYSSASAYSIATDAAKFLAATLWN